LAEVSNGRANLHLHTIFSDGELPPAEVVAAHAAAGFEVIALTDHDTLAGIDAVGGLEGHGLRMISGVELSIEDEPGRGLVDAHLLGYGFALNNRRLRNRLHQASEARETQKRETVDRLAAAGYTVSWEAVRAGARGNVGKPHIVAAIEAAQPGVAREELYAAMGPGGVAHVARSTEMSLDEAVDLVTAAGGATVLAHRETEDVDIALLSAQTDQCVPARPAAGPELGEAVWVIGFPWGRNMLLASGIVSQVSFGDAADGESQSRLMVDASVSYGSSGGGVYEARGGGLLGLVEGYRTARVTSKGTEQPWYIDVPVPGQTLVTPLTDIRRFLADTGHADLIEGTSSSTGRAAR